jgi:hypothetical protein
MAGVELKLDGRFLKQARGVFEKYTFDVGILQDRPHFQAKGKTKGLKSFAGGPARQISHKPSGMSISEVSEELRKNLVTNFYTRPFKSKNNKDILRFTKSFFDLCSGRGERRRCENLLQAVVRNPILRGDYGRNTRATAKAKGFNRLMIDTAQLFQAIQARVRVNRNVSK